jgi:peptidoglycan/LPS O-acetylase OafA/YrhL
MAESHGLPASRPRALDTTLLKAIAALLVANSHLEHFYPHAWMAGDGLLGNSLFFLLAGYGLVRSERARARPFRSWMWRRIVRLYPTVLLVVSIGSLLFGGAWRTWTAADYLTNLAWPTNLTFVQLIIPFYVLFFVLMKMGGRTTLFWAMVATAIPYLGAYVPDALRTAPGDTLHLGTRPLLVHVSAYFQVMLLGGWLGWRDSWEWRSLSARFAGLLAVSVVYIAVKLAMVEGHFSQMYLAMHALTFLWCLLVFECLGAPQVIARARERKALWKGLAFVGALTLEIYVVHASIAESPRIYGVRYPLNLALFWALTLSLAWATGRVVSVIQRRLRGSDVPADSSAPTATDAVPTTATV